MLVSQIMKKDFFKVPPTASVQEAAKKMRDKHVGTVLVYEHDHVAGIVTEKEIAKAMAAKSDDLGSSPSGDMVINNSVHDDGNRCCYLSDVQIDLLLNA